MSSRLPAGLRWNDFQKYYRGHPNGATADRWQEYQALHAKGGAGQAAAVKVEQEAKAEPPVWRAPRPITPTKRNVTDVADRLWERKRAGKEWARPDAEQKRQRGIGRVVLDRCAAPRLTHLTPASPSRRCPCVRPVTVFARAAGA